MEFSLELEADVDRFEITRGPITREQHARN